MLNQDQKSAVVWSGRDRQASTLESMLASAGWSVRRVTSAKELDRVALGGFEGVIFADYDGTEGRWACALRISESASPAVPVIVFSRLADEHLWAEVLCLGGYDVVSEPFEANEVLRVAASAWRGMLESRRPRYAA